MTQVDPAANEVLVVVAHPDDEAFWFTPLLRSASRIVAALPVHGEDEVISRGRYSVLDGYPVCGFEFLPLRSAGVYKRSDWLRRRPIEEGVTLLRKCPKERVSTYMGNYASLLEALEPYVRSSQVIYTHNPWGEYGHEEHIQVSHAVMALATKEGRSVWAWDGFSSRLLLAGRMRLRHDYYRGQTKELPRSALGTDRSLFREIRELYKSYSAWTGDPHYEPPETSEYIQLVRDGKILIESVRPPSALKLRMAVRTAALDSTRKARHRLPHAIRPRVPTW